ncbi:mannosyltransferase [Armillaria novae-zelandiae]|uniref:Chitobiosyldiphosphodolichol beta-mannosyltransferase n=1 Tax=Armillaria novae-zelandiae TaxID=153914 RepID=A0AA39P6C0_9AGAR|nr:mannosyltransferase [Armillaria novae-zelandiae]
MTTTSNLRVGEFVVACLLLWLSWKFLQSLPHSLRSVAILVLGDIGRSPRMMYHAESFAENGFETNIIGYSGSTPIPSLQRLPVAFRHLPQLPTCFRRLPFIFFAPLKIVHQIASVLLELLVRIPKPPEFILVQNPPSIPTLAIVYFVGRIRGCKVIIDWHNLGYSILAIKLGPDHLFVRIAKWVEATFGRSAYAHLFVTQAMCDFLVKEWDLQGHKAVLHDRPPRLFHRCSPQEVHDLFVKLKPSIAAPKSLTGWLPPSSMPYSTPFTDTTSQIKQLPEKPSDVSLPSLTSGVPFKSKSLKSFHATISTPTESFDPPSYSEIHSPRLRRDRPALVVSSTSWTPDEDFGILREALEIYEARAKELNLEGPQVLPKLLMVVTGKGDLRDEYMQSMEKLQRGWTWVRCVSLWLEPEDYPLLLGSADLGVSLHSSSSALDLPMKIVDMFGCGLPVCALKFKCLDELVKEGVNGLIFEDSADLAIQLESLLTNFPSSTKLSSLLQRTSKQTTSHVHAPHDHAEQTSNVEWEWSSWDENWGRVMRPLILRDVQR